MFILRYIDEPKIRQAVEKELNKLEHTQRFAKAVFHDNNHEFHQETREEQLVAEGCKRQGLRMKLLRSISPPPGTHFRWKACDF